MAKRAFGELEMAILHILKSGERMTVREVHHILGGDDKYTTIMTVMNRLAEKNRLARERVGLQYEYWLIEPQIPSSFIEQLKKKIFGVKTVTMVNHLIESAEDISDDDLEAMEKMIEQARRNKKKK